MRRDGVDVDSKRAVMAAQRLADLGCPCCRYSLLLRVHVHATCTRRVEIVSSLLVRVVHVRWIMLLIAIAHPRIVGLSGQRSRVCRVEDVLQLLSGSHCTT